jgi:hypothetical protein
MSVKLHMFTISLVLFFAVYQGFYVLLNENTSAPLKVFAVIILLCVFYLSANYTTFLPFLGETAIPLSAFKDLTPKKKEDIVFKVDIAALDNTRVIYWASKSSPIVFSNPKDAYEQSPNVGVAEVRNNVATFYTTCPSSYNVPMGAVIKPHIHYRVVKSNGLLGAVKTVKVNCA